MTVPAMPKGAESPVYRLNHEPDVTSWTAGESLADNLERELLGPMYVPEEVIDGKPDSAYLIGRIEPFKLASGQEDPADAETGESDTDVGNADDSRVDHLTVSGHRTESFAGVNQDVSLGVNPVLVRRDSVEYAWS